MEERYFVEFAVDVKNMDRAADVLAGIYGGENTREDNDRDSSKTFELNFCENPVFYGRADGRFVSIDFA